MTSRATGAEEGQGTGWGGRGVGGGSTTGKQSASADEEASTLARFHSRLRSKASREASATLQRTCFCAIIFLIAELAGKTSSRPRLGLCKTGCVILQVVFFYRTDGVVRCRPRQKRLSSMYLVTMPVFLARQQD